MLEIDKLCYTSRLRYVNAGEKCFFSLASVILCIVSRSIPAALLLLLTSTYLTVQRGGIFLGRWLKYLTLPLFFLLLSTGAILINISQVPLDAFALPVGSLYLTGSREGVFQAVQLILTALACVSALFFLSFNTPMTDILAVLESCRLPRLLIELMMLTYRFIFLLLENASSMLLSQNARLGNKDLRTSLKSPGGILRPDEGQIYYDGQPVSYRKKELLDLRKKVGIVFQNPDMQLFSASVYQEISFGPLNLGLSETEAKREVEEVIQKLGIAPFRHRPAHALSGGQKKQVALADILVMHPELLILDEPFAALDPSHVRIIRDMIQSLGEDRSMTVVTATHDTGFALSWADEVILFREGQVLAQGTPARILTDRELLSKTSLEVPAVIQVFETLQAAGILSKGLPSPKSFEQLNMYIKRTAHKENTHGT